MFRPDIMDADHYEQWSRQHLRSQPTEMICSPTSTVKGNAPGWERTTTTRLNFSHIEEPGAGFPPPPGHASQFPSATVAENPRHASHAMRSIYDVLWRYAEDEAAVYRLQKEVFHHFYTTTDRTVAHHRAARKGVFHSHLMDAIFHTQRVLRYVDHMNCSQRLTD